MSLLILADVKQAMNMTTTANDVELQKIMDAAEAAVTQRCGPLVPTASTTRVTGGRDKLSLPCTPVISLTTVTPVGSTAIDVSLLNVSKFGVIEYLKGGSFAANFYDVTYSAGRATCPADLYNATIEMVRHLWGPQRGGSKRPGSDTSTVPNIPGYFLPYRVQGALEPHMQPGFA